eukprot:g16701.t1
MPYREKLWQLGEFISWTSCISSTVPEDVKDEVPGFQLVRVDRWTVDCTGLQLLHFPSYKAFITGRRPGREPAFFAPPQTHSLYSVSSEEEEAIQRQISTASGGSVLPNLKRMRFAKKEPEGHKSINFVAKIGVISMRFRCLPEEAVELKGHKAALYFDLFQGFARIGLNMGLLEMSAGRRFNLARAESESKHVGTAEST